jgi:hypothetical protein
MPSDAAISRFRSPFQKQLEDGHFAGGKRRPADPLG